MNNFNELKDAICEIGRACRVCVDAVLNRLKEVVPLISLSWQMCLTQNRRVKHLALHAKKARVRKKNINRIRKAVRRNEKIQNLQRVSTI